MQTLSKVGLISQMMLFQSHTRYICLYYMLMLSMDFNYHTNAHELFYRLFSDTYIFGEDIYISAQIQVFLFRVFRHLEYMW